MPKQKTLDQHKAVAKALKKGASVQDALLAGGYSKTSAKRGYSMIENSKPLRRVLRKQGLRLMDIGRGITNQDLAALAKGRLVENIKEGVDEAVGSSKLALQVAGALGDDRVNIAVVMPAQFAASLEPTLKTIDAQSVDSAAHIIDK